MLVICVPQLMKDLEAFKCLTEEEVTPTQQMIVIIQAVAYLVGDSSVLGFGLVVWSQRRLLLEAREFTPPYQGRSYNFIEEGNLTEQIERSVEQGDLENVELFIFVGNLVFDRVFYKGTSKSLLLFELVIRLNQVQIKGGLIVHSVHITGTRMV